ncbi:MAG: type II toxin-antitoxin system VapB family antitoxin [Terriglobales bacterium]
MALSIKSGEADRLVRRIAALTGESLTQAIVTALRERLRRVEGRSQPQRLSEALMEIGRHCAQLPELDTRPAEEILGYDEHGVPR